jgi:benzoate-CoA ligase family
MPEPANIAARLLSRNLERHPDKAAFLCGDDALTFRALAADSARFANLLRARGVAPGDRVVLCLPDSFAAPKAFFGALLLGAVPVPVSAQLTKDDCAFILRDSGASALATWEDSPAAQAARNCPEVACVLRCGPHGPWGLADFSPAFGPVAQAADAVTGAAGFMLYSSGSTGRPKGVPHRQEDLLVPAQSWGSAVLGVRADDVIFSASKFSFACGLIASFSLALSFGATAVLFSGKPGPYELLAEISRHRPTLFFCVPTLYSLLLRAYEPGGADMDLSSLRLCYSAGEALPEALCREWTRATGVEILDGIGSTEACNVFISNRPGRVRCGASGELVPGYEARLVDDAGAPVPDGTPGNLQVRGAGTCAAYLNRPEKTAETMLPEGWLATGDVYVREGGVFTHKGRGDDMLKVGAYWVSPVQVEEALREHPAVQECAVAGLAVEGLVRPCAHVVPAPGAEPGQQLSAALLRFARGRLAPQMCPVRVVFHAELPKTATGKVQRFRLRQL